VSFETIVTLISTTTTGKGLKVYCKMDHHDYLTKIKVTDEADIIIQKILSWRMELRYKAR
jgi:hypothetical protein